MRCSCRCGGGCVLVCRSSVGGSSALALARGNPRRGRGFLTAFFMSPLMPLHGQSPYPAWALSSLPADPAGPGSVAVILAIPSVAVPYVMPHHLGGAAQFRPAHRGAGGRLGASPTGSSSRSPCRHPARRVRRRGVSPLRPRLRPSSRCPVFSSSPRARPCRLG